VYRQNGVAGVIHVVEQGPELGLLEGLLEPVNGGLGVGLDAFTLGGELDEDIELLLLVEDLLEEPDILLEELFLLLEGLGGFLVPPDLGRGQTGVYGFALGGLAFQVKENLGPLRLSRKGR